MPIPGEISTTYAHQARQPCKRMQGNYVLRECPSLYLQLTLMLNKDGRDSSLPSLFLQERLWVCGSVGRTCSGRALELEVVLDEERTVAKNSAVRLPRYNRIAIVVPRDVPMEEL